MEGSRAYGIQILDYYRQLSWVEIHIQSERDWTLKDISRKNKDIRIVARGTSEEDLASR